MVRRIIVGLKRRSRLVSYFNKKWKSPRWNSI